MEPQNTGQPGRLNQPGPHASPNPTPAQPHSGQTPSRPLVISDFRQQPAGQPASNPAPQTAGAQHSVPAQPATGTAHATSATETPAASAPPAAALRRPSFAKPAPPDIQPHEKQAEKSSLRDILSIVGVLVSALLLAFCLISFVFQSYQVDGPSMQTTLENNDHLIVWKVSKTVAKMTGQHYIPNRGDVIIFNEPISDGTTQNKQLIKRVMALPGERITVKDGVVTVFNKEHPEGFQPDKTLPYGNVITTTPGNVDVTLRENEVFVCGDNRTNSLDSRIFGPINSDQIVGKLVLRVLPLNTVKSF